MSDYQRVHFWLVVSTPLKNISQLGWLSHIFWKIKNVWNHQPDLNEVWLPTLHPWPISCRVVPFGFGISFSEASSLQGWTGGLRSGLVSKFANPRGFRRTFFNGTYQVCHFWGICSLSVSSILRHETTKTVIVLYVQSRKIHLGRTNGGPSRLRFPQLRDAYLSFPRIA